MALDNALQLAQEAPSHPDFEEARAEAYFPEIDYDSHPYYREFATPDETVRRVAQDRFLESFLPLVRAEQALSAKVNGKKKPAPDGSTDPALIALEDLGMHRFKLTPSQLEETYRRSQAAADVLKVRREQLSPAERGVEGVSQLVANSAAPDDNFAFFDDLLRVQGIYELCERYYQFPFRLKFVNLQMNSGEDTTISDVCSFPDGRRASTYYMHIDTTIGAMKILMYRSERVTQANGAFRFVPRSHRALNPVDRAIRKANDKCGFDPLNDKSRQLLMGLPPYLRKKANFGNDLLPEVGFDNESLIAREVICEGEAGDGFLCDINGIHRGNLHLDPNGQREMFQILLIPA